MSISTQVLLSAMLIALGSGTQAQNLIGEVLCGTEEEIHAKLTRQFGAVKAGEGLRDPDAMLEIWTNPKSGDWTLVQSYAGGRTCILAMGEYWEMITPAPDESAGTAG
ncbi:hypothetical protein [Celeribacter neptunius]|uniref:Uncharacterized protein n=1 Tax=Celeribacter neptunius TaxID=588602 RepID=A0A1I3IVY9_9RHOB|nr:hypothetical protein [Celeribacter neptunius]SFI52023.1 hypothetical protein SAMN04487991_0151 [Celeribacter neptunius]